MVDDAICRPEYMDSTLVIVNELWGHHYGDIDDNGSGLAVPEFDTESRPGEFSQNLMIKQKIIVSIKQRHLSSIKSSVFFLICRSVIPFIRIMTMAVLPLMIITDIQYALTYRFLEYLQFAAEKRSSCYHQTLSQSAAA